MGNQFLYGGIQTPFWQQIDKIHYGPAYGEAITHNGKLYLPLSPNDEIMLGRYVLVKYTDLVLSQDQKYELINNSGNANQLVLAALWKKCFEQDKSQIETLKNDDLIFTDYDGVVFKKVFQDSDVKYIPIASLSTTVSAENGISKAEVEKNYLKQADAASTYLKQGDAESIYLKQTEIEEPLARLEAVEAFFENEEIQDEVIDTLKEIQDQFGEDATLIQNLEDAVETNAANIQTNTNNITNLTTKIDNIGKMAVIDIDTVDPNGEKEADGWLKPSNNKILLNTIYTKFLYSLEETIEINPGTIEGPGPDLNRPFKIKFEGDWWAAKAGMTIENTHSNYNLPLWKNDRTPYPLFYYNISSGGTLIGHAILSLTQAQNDVVLYYSLSADDIENGYYTKYISWPLVSLESTMIDINQILPNLSITLVDWSNDNTTNIISQYNCSIQLNYGTPLSQEIRYIELINGQNAWISAGNTSVAPQWEMF